MRSLQAFGSITGEVRRPIFDRDPEDIRSFIRSLQRQAKERKGGESDDKGDLHRCTIWSGTVLIERAHERMPKSHSPRLWHARASLEQGRDP